MKYHERQHLLFDADDTLWENNRYFEEAFHDFVVFLNHEHLTHAEIQEVLDTFQRENRHKHGYGSRSFATSLKQTFQHITGVADDDPVLDEVQSIGLRILRLDMQPIADVETTLTDLRPHHDLIMITKGDPYEQQAKISRSGLVDYFRAAVVVTEKTSETYLEAIESLQLQPERTWMIGNSPRSDINPALNAGINAVFIPHERTWHLEVEELSHIAGHHPGELLQVDRFAQLRDIFLPVEQR
jgi:putative hydrolase of the HAD superfamily